MSFLTKLFGNRAEKAAEPGVAVAEKAKPKNNLERVLELKTWRCVLVPAVELHFSRRCLAVASRLARESNARILLIYLIEVPRALPLDAELPEEESIAHDVLTRGESIVKNHHIAVEARVFRTRNVRDGILKLIQQEGVDLLVLGRRHDGARGLTLELAKDFFEEAPCEVIVDYIGVTTKTGEDAP